MKHIISLILIAILSLSHLQAHEGMWLFDAPPRERIKEKFDFELTDEWLERLQKSTVRFGRGGSASFVSPQGLILTNQHVGVRIVQQLSTADNNLVENGFYAATLEDELPCPGLEIWVTMFSEDVTDKVNADIAQAHPNTGGLTPTALAPEEAQRLRRNAIARLEAEYSEKTGLRCEVVTLFHGGMYYMYGYKVYTDVRLVWTPESSIGAFGGDPDNFEFPRYCLDAAFFRAYEDGVPARVEHYLKWGADGIQEGELVFISGFPGRTERSFTREHLEFQRDVFFPWHLQKLFRREVVFSTFASKSEENRRRIADDLRRVQNTRKRAMGQLLGLQRLLAWDSNPSQFPTAKGKDANSPEAKIAAALEAARKDDLYIMYDLFERGEAFNSRIFQIANTLIRLETEMQKPEEERLPEFRGSRLETTKASLFDDAPIYEDVEILKMTDALSMLAETKGFRGLAISGISDAPPMETAKALIRGTKVQDVAVRKRIAEIGFMKYMEEARLSEEEVDKLLDRFRNQHWSFVEQALALADPKPTSEEIEQTIEQLTQFLDSFTREVFLEEFGEEIAVAAMDSMLMFIAMGHSRTWKFRTQYDEQVTAPLEAAYAEIAQRRFAEHGTSVYPDATFTLRLSYGTVRGYTDSDGNAIHPFTYMSGLFERAEQQGWREPWSLPQSWLDGRECLDMAVPFNFVSTLDTIGGNSGSPVVNTRGELVGIHFDGNIYRLPNNIMYIEDRGRAIAVHAAAIIEALHKIYGAQRILDELEASNQCVFP